MMTSMATGMPLLPGWLALVLTVALCAVWLLHLRHAWVMRGSRRWWHAGHMAMAAGMIAMCLLPQAQHARLYWAGVCAFGALGAGAGSFTVAIWRREGRPDWLWVAATADMGAMAYMSLPATDRAALLSYLFVAYLCVEALLWALVPSPSLARVRVTPAVMSVSMAWMLIAMQAMNMTTGVPMAPMHM